MTRLISLIVLSALVIYCTTISGCALPSGSKPVRLAGSDSNVDPVSTPSDSQYPKSKGFVNDFAGTLTSEEAENLESVLRELQTRGKIDFAIAIVRSTNGKDIFDYSLGMAKEWGIGSENGGILLVLATEDRNWRIQIDKKLENKFTNDEIRAIGDTMVPHFRELRYNDGLRTCVKVFLEELARKHDFKPIDF